jgi:hypothetical protein
MGWATFLADFSTSTHLVTLFAAAKKKFLGAEIH